MCSGSCGRFVRMRNVEMVVLGRDLLLAVVVLSCCCAVSCGCCGGSKKPSSSEVGSCGCSMCRLDVVLFGVILYCTSA